MTNSIREVIRKLVEENSSKGIEKVVVRQGDITKCLNIRSVYSEDGVAIIETEEWKDAPENPSEEDSKETEISSSEETESEKEVEPERKRGRRKKEAESAESDEPQDSQEPQETESEEDVTEEEDVESLKEV